MPQNALPFQYEVDESGATTGWAGLCLFAALFVKLGLLDAARSEIGVRQDGWDDGLMTLALVLLNIVGGVDVGDLDALDSDRLLSEAMLRAKLANVPRRKRRQIQRAWRRERKRGRSSRQVPSASSTFRWLYCFHDREAIEQAQGAAQAAGRIAFVPQEPAALEGLWRLNALVVAALQERRPQRTATLDMDATCVEAHKDSAKWCYKGFPGYQPLNVYWHEQDAIVYSQFRDGNVPANFGQRQVLERALELLPDGVEQVLLRCDTAGYQWDLMRFCAEGHSERFGRIDFAVGADLTPQLIAEVSKLPADAWKRLKRPAPDGGEPTTTKHEYAEVVYVPNQACRSKCGPSYRFIVTREKVREGQNGAVQLALPSIGNADKVTLTADGTSNLFKLYAVCTTLSWPADEIIWWHRARCGASEQAHTTMKRDLAGAVMPCDRFGANAAWWAIMVLAYNLVTVLKSVVLGDGWRRREMKALRLHVIHVAGRIVRHGRQLFVKVSAAAYKLLNSASERIEALGVGPPEANTT